MPASGYVLLAHSQSLCTRRCSSIRPSAYVSKIRSLLHTKTTTSKHSSRAAPHSQASRDHARLMVALRCPECVQSGWRALPRPHICCLARELHPRAVTLFTNRPWPHPRTHRMPTFTSHSLTGSDPFRTFRSVHALRKHVQADHSGCVCKV